MRTPLLAAAPGVLRNSAAEMLDWIRAGRFISNDELSRLAGINVGLGINPSVDWVKFRRQGKILYFPMKCIRCGDITPDTLRPLGLLEGQKLIQYQGQTYRVRCLSTSKTPSPDIPFNTSINPPATEGSEWNDLMYPLVSPNAYKKYWRYNFVRADLGFTGDDQGSLTLTQETTAQGGWIYRGYDAVDKVVVGTVIGNTKLRGWRPVLELVG